MMNSGRGLAITLSQIRRRDLFPMNRFFREVERSLRGYGMNLDFSEDESGGRIPDLLQKTGRKGMMEASDHNSMDLV